LLSLAGLIGLGLFEQYNSMLSELRGDLKRFNETSAEYVKREQMQRCWEKLRQVDKELNAANTARVPLEQELKACERSRDELTKELQRLRERLAYLEGQQAARAYTP
jgi:septal ring factor EnvC (AmiA/AmiB activator)